MFLVTFLESFIFHLYSIFFKMSLRIYVIVSKNEPCANKSYTSLIFRIEFLPKWLYLAF